MIQRDAYDVGRRMLEAFDRGRELVNEARKARARALSDLVAIELERERNAGLPRRGRAARIARRLRGAASVRHLNRLLDTLYSASDST